MREPDRRQMFGLAGAGVALFGLTSAQAQTAPSPNVVSPENRSPTPPVPMLHADVNGVRLAYQHHVGMGGPRPPLVFVHGYSLRSTGLLYAELIGRLTDQFDVYALDYRGHGGSAGAVAGWSQEAIADDLAAFVSTLGLRNALFAGHSLGGFTGLFTQIRHPGTFSALALLATAAAQGGAPPEGLRETWVARGRERAFARATFADMYLNPGPEDISRSVEAVGLVDPAVHEAFFSRYGAIVLTERLAEVQVPVLLINGLKDTVVPPADQHATAVGLPWSKEVAFSTEGHMLPIESPAATAREMTNFFINDVGEICAAVSRNSAAV